MPSLARCRCRSSSRSRSARPGRACSSRGRSTRRPAAGPRSCRRRRSSTARRGVGRDSADAARAAPRRRRAPATPRSASGGGAAPSSRARRGGSTLPCLSAEHLHLDVARVRQVALQVHRRVGEELLALARGALEGRPRARPSVSATRKPLPPPPPAALTATGKPICPWRSCARRPRRRRPARSCPGRSARPPPASARARRVFEPIASIALAGGPMKTIPAFSQARGERGVLGEEAVARVDRLGARLSCATSRIFSITR